MSGKIVVGVLMVCKKSIAAEARQAITESVPESFFTHGEILKQFIFRTPLRQKESQNKERYPGKSDLHRPEAPFFGESLLNVGTPPMQHVIDLISEP